ncbi:glycosyltransferase family 2 protein, partial [Candidatus Gottesmanbacteria bacterium]|nr:glycosyltransferase family 2 protein [Candidatus Gottesmanbacteria bacterium]
RRHLEGDFASQRNYGLSKAKGDWVLFVDADEIVSKELASEIKYRLFRLGKSFSGQAKSLSNQVTGFYLKRLDYFLGQWLRYGETGSIRLIRLARREAGTWKGRVHEHWGIEGKVGQLNNPLLHYSHKNISLFLKKINRYTDIVAQYWKEQGREITFWQILLYPLGKFIHNYLVRRGFLDGVPGLIMALMMSFHSFLTRGKLWLSIKNFKKKNNGNSV